MALALPMPIERVYATPKIRYNAGRVALQRGPVVYCLEAADNGSDLNGLTLPRNAGLDLGGVSPLNLRSQRVQAAAQFVGVYLPGRDILLKAHHGGDSRRFAEGAAVLLNSHGSLGGESRGQAAARDQ